MATVRFDISVSLDGFIAGPNPSEQDPLGEGGMQLHEWAFELAAWREPHGHEGGEVNASTAVMEEMLADVGAVVMGRNMFGGGPGPGATTPGRAGGARSRRFTRPCSSLTHHAREPLERGRHDLPLRHRRRRVGARAGQAGGRGRDVSLAGGADVAQQCSPPG